MKCRIILHAAAVLITTLTATGKGNLMVQTLKQTTSEPAAAANAALTAGSMSAQDAQDTKDILATLDAMDRAWAAHDMIQFTSFMTPDVEWVNIVGMWWRGKKAVLHAHQVLHATMFKNMTGRTDGREIALLAPGVALATTTSWHDGFVSPDGRPFPSGQDRMTEVLVKQSDGHWLVRSGHNTPIDARAAVHDLALTPLPSQH